jgi:hypothetical protein
MHSIRRTTVGLATAGLLAATAACGSSGDSGNDGKDGDKQETRSQGAIAGALKASLDKSQEVTSASFETEMIMTMALEPGEEPLVLPMYMSGEMAWDPLAMDVTMDMSGYFEAFAEMLESEEEIPSGEFNIRFVDNVMYMGGPVFQDEFPAGKSWIKLDLEEMAAESGDAELGALMEQFEQAEEMAQSPAEQLGLLLEAPSVEHRGSEKMAGRDTERYSGELTLEELLAVDPSTAMMSDEDIQQMHDDFQEMGADTIGLDIWVDDEDLPARIDMTIEMPEGTVDYTTTYRDYGTGITVDHPAEAEVAGPDEIEDFSGFGGAGAGGGMGAEGAGSDAGSLPEGWTEEDLADMENWTEEDWEEYFAAVEGEA